MELKLMKNSKIVYLAIFLFASSVLYSQIFEEVKTPFKYIHNIKFLPNNLLFVSGDSIPVDLYSYSPFIPYMGSGFYLSNNFGKEFTGPYLAGKTVFDLIGSQKNPQTFFATAHQFTRGCIFKSTDGAKTWDLTPLHEEVRVYQKLISTPSPDNKELFIVSSQNSVDGLSFSMDYFETLLPFPTIKTQVYDFKISKELNSYFVATDNSTIGHVARLTPNGLIRSISGLTGLRVLCVQPSKLKPGYIYCGADSITSQKISIGKGIFYSIDTGKTWKPLTAAGYQVYEIQEHPSDPNFLAAACGKLGVGISGNYGKWFDVLSEGLPSNFDCRKVIIPDIPSNSSGIQVWASLQNGGLYKSKNIRSNVEEYISTSKLEFSNIYPNPASDNFTIVINIPESRSISIDLMDNMGTVVLSEQFTSLNTGSNMLTFNDINLMTGKYFIRINDGYSSIIHNLIIIK